MASKVRVCCIGCGGMAGKYHYPSLKEMEDVELVALSELDDEKMKSGVEKFKFQRTYSDYREMLKKEKPDAVYVLMPPQVAFPVLKHCLSSKFNVFSEKPPALTTYQTGVLSSIAESNGNITQIGYQRKFVPLVRKMREMIEKKGPIDQFTVTFCKNQADGLYYDGVVDVLTTDASHMLDTMLWLGGSEPVEVVSAVRNSYTDTNVKYNALVLFEEGVTGFFSANWNSGRRFLEIEIHGQRCVAKTDVENSGTYYDGDNPDGIAMTAQEAAGSDLPHRVLGFFDQSRNFIDCVKRGERPLGCLQSALRTMELIDKVYSNSIC